MWFGRWWQLTNRYYCYLKTRTLLPLDLDDWRLPFMQDVHRIRLMHGNHAGLIAIRTSCFVKQVHRDSRVISQNVPLHVFFLKASFVPKEGEQPGKKNSNLPAETLGRLCSRGCESDCRIELCRGPPTYFEPRLPRAINIQCRRHCPVPQNLFSLI